jgi:hypothetical protein
MMEYFHSVLDCYHNIVDLFGQLRDFHTVLHCLFHISRQAVGLVDGSASLLFSHNLLVSKVFSEIQLFSSEQWKPFLDMISSQHQSDSVDSLSRNRSPFNIVESFLFAALLKVIVVKDECRGQIVALKLSSVVNELSHKLLENSFFPVGLFQLIDINASLQLFFECVRYSQFYFVSSTEDASSDSDLWDILTVHTPKIVGAADRLLDSCLLNRSPSIEFYVCGFVKRVLELKLTLLQTTLILRSKNLDSFLGKDIATLSSVEKEILFSVNRNLSLLYPLYRGSIADGYLLLGVVSSVMKYLCIWSDPVFEKFLMSSPADVKHHNVADFLSCGFDLFVLSYGKCEGLPPAVEDDVNTLREIVRRINYSVCPSFSLYLVRLVMKKLSVYNRSDHLEVMKCGRFLFLVLDIFPTEFLLAFEFEVQVQLMEQITTLLFFLLPMRSTETVNDDSDILISIFNFISTMSEFHWNIHSSVGSIYMCDSSKNNLLSFANSFPLIEMLLNRSVCSSCSSSSDSVLPSHKGFDFFKVIESFLPRLLFDCFLSSINQSSEKMSLDEFMRLLLQIIFHFVMWYSNCDDQSKLTAEPLFWSLLHAFHLVFEKILLFLQGRNFLGQFLMVSKLFNAIWELLQTLQSLISEISSSMFYLQCYVLGFYGKCCQISFALFAFYCRKLSVERYRRNVLRTIHLRMRFKLLKLLESSVSFTDSFVQLLKARSDYSYTHCIGVFTLAGTSAYGRHFLDKFSPRATSCVPPLLRSCLFSEGLKDLVRKKLSACCNLDDHIEDFVYFSRSISQCVSLLLVSDSSLGANVLIVLEKEFYWLFESVFWIEACVSGLVRFGLIFTALHCYYSQAADVDPTVVPVLRRLLFTTADEIISTIQSCDIHNGHRIQAKLMISLTVAMTDLLNVLAVAVSRQESLAQRFLASELNCITTSSLALLTLLGDVLVKHCADTVFFYAFRSAVYLFHCVATLGSRSLIRSYKLRFSIVLQVLLQFLRVGFQFSSPQLNMDYLLNRLLLLLSNTDSIRKHVFVLTSVVVAEFSCHHGLVFQRFSSGLLTLYVKLSEKDKQRIYQLMSNSGKEILSKLASQYCQSQIYNESQR